MSDVARRWIGIALAGVGLATLLLLFLSNPPPTPYERWANGGDARGHLLVAIGPAEARYEPEGDVTRALFWCGHGRCANATSLAGDQRDLVAKRSVVLSSPIAPPPRATETIAAMPGNVTSATLARFEPGAAWFTLTIYQAAFALLAIGTMLGAGASATRAVIGAVGLGLGLFIGTMVAPYTEGLVPAFLTFLVLAAGVVCGVSARWWPRIGHVAAALLAAGAAMVFSLLVTADFFAHPPTV